MDLSVSQKDSLTELINIGYGRAAGALSELTGYRIALEVRKVAMQEIHEIARMLESVVPGEVASVNQVFSGPIGGNALLLLDEEAALMLSKLFAETNLPSTTRGLDASAREVI